jgi:Zn-finger nucleic acid-binding protein
MAIQICPRCGNPCQIKTYEGVTIDECVQCKGVWLDSGELELVIERQESQFTAGFTSETLRLSSPMIPESEKTAILKCPLCEQSMRTMNFNYSSGVIINTCPRHGAWFDHEELQRVEAHMEHWKDEKKSARIQKIAADAEKAGNEEVARFQHGLKAHNPLKSTIIYALYIKLTSRK